MSARPGRGGVAADLSWHHRALCASHEHSDWWSSESVTELESAAALCQSCPVISECLSSALREELHMSASSVAAVRGGLLPARRIEMSRALRAAARMAERSH